MKSFKYMGKYSGNEEDLPQRQHPEDYVPFNEVQDVKKLSLILNVAAIIIVVILYLLMFIRNKGFLWNNLGILLSLVCAIPHEFLHAICFKDTVYMYTNLKQGMLFVVGPEDMTKARFVFMSLLPNIIFGFIPFLIFMIYPDLKILGMMGLFSISMGVGDYYNVFNALTQMPKGAYTYLSGFHSYWYLSKQQNR